MATLTNEQIEARKQQAEAAAGELSDDALEQAAGGIPPGYQSLQGTPPGAAPV